MQANDQSMAKIEMIKRWSPVWIIPIVTLLIGAWVLYDYFSHKGPEITLITSNAEGLQAGKTAIKSRSVTVGMVKSITLSKDFDQVTITARLNSGMGSLLRADSVFWVVKPQIGRGGVTGLDTLLSGAYIELQPGNSSKEEKKFTLLNDPPLSPPDAKGLRITLESKQANRLLPGDPVLFRGFKVGSVEISHFDPTSRQMRYQLFINDPYERLVTSNVRFWQEAAISFDMSAQGINVELGALSALLNGGVTFDVPEGWAAGEAVANNAVYDLYADKKSIQDSLFTNHKDFLLLFNESVRGLVAGAPVEFRGVRIGTVDKVPYLTPDLSILREEEHSIPVLIRIEPDRLEPGLSERLDLQKLLIERKRQGLRAALKSGNLLTGALYIDLDYYPDAPPWKKAKSLDGYMVMPTISVGLAQIQQKVVQTLDKLNNLPLDPMLQEMTKSLQSLQSLLGSLNKLTSDQSMQSLPEELQKTLLELNRNLQGLQPGSPVYNNMQGNMQQLGQVLRELKPVLRTLNDKSNALIFSAPPTKDPDPRRAK